jgi:hypothetical protein
MVNFGPTRTITRNVNISKIQDDGCRPVAILDF